MSLTDKDVEDIVNQIVSGVFVEELDFDEEIVLESTDDEQEYSIEDMRVNNLEETLAIMNLHKREDNE